jgi:hypothetical protein
MAEVRQWKAGTADEVWKVIICARDAYHADEVLSSLIYILTDAGDDTERGNVLLKEMSGAQIVDGLLTYINGCRESVKNGIKKNEKGLAE